MNISAFVGLGLLSGFLADGKPIMYCGGTLRFPHIGEQEDEPYLVEFTKRIAEGVATLKRRGDVQPVEGAVVEMAGCWEHEDVVLMWRVPCLEIVTH
jgi:hypothetical protein